MISVGQFIATLTLLIASLLPARSLAALPPQATASATATCVSQTGPGIPPPAVIPTKLSGFHAAWYGQSGYMQLCAGERATSPMRPETQPRDPELRYASVAVARSPAQSCM